MKILPIPVLLLVAALSATPARAQEPAVPLPKVGGYFQLRETAQEQVGLSALLNRARISVDGSLPNQFSYRGLLEMEASTGSRTPATVSLREAVIRWNPAPFSIYAGQYKVPFSREYLIPVPLVETADFAACVDSIAPKYDIGVTAEYAPGALGSLAVGIFNGEGQNSTVNRDSVAMLVARIVARPIPQLALGANATRDGADSSRWGVEANAEELGAVVRSEYLVRHRRGRASDQDDFGWYVFGGYRVMRFVQLIGRQEDFQRPSYGISRRVRATTLGVNLDLAPNRVKLLLEGVRRMSGANQTRVDAFIAQLQARF